MNKKQLYFLISFAFILLISINIFYFFYLKEQVSLLYYGNSDVWFKELVYKLYPQFEVEKHRFNLSFFLEKSLQVIFRFDLFSFLLLSSFLFIKDKISFFEQEKNMRNENYWRIGYYGFVLIVSYDWFESLILLENIRSFFHPISFLKVFSTMPSLFTNLSIYILMVLSALACIFNYKPRFFSWICITCFLFIHALFCSFEKMNHVFTTFIYVGLLFPFSFYSKTSWNIQLLKIAIVLTYFFAGTEKLLVSHFSWLNPITFKAYLSLHQAPLGMWVAENTFLCTILPIGALLFQLTFFIILFIPKLTKWYILGGFIFHWGTTLLFGISWFMNPWLMPYIFFLNFEKISLWIENK